MVMIAAYRQTRSSNCSA